MSTDTLAALFHWGMTIIGGCLVVTVLCTTVHMLGMAWKDWKQ